MSDRADATKDQATDTAKEGWAETKGDLGDAFSSIKERASGVVQDLTGDHESTTELFDVEDEGGAKGPPELTR